MSKLDSFIDPDEKKALLKNPLSLIENKKIYEVLWLHYANNYSQFGLGEKFIEKLFKILEENKSNPQTAVELLNSFFAYDKEYLEAIKQKDKTKAIYRILKPHLNNYQTFVDFGCGKLSLLKTLAREERDPNLKFIGIDGDSNPVIENFDKRISYLKQEKGNDETNIPLIDSSADILNIQFVLHHLKNEEVIKKIILEAKRVLRDKGRLIIWEESFSENTDKETLNKNANEYLSSLGLMLSEEVTKKFNSLSEIEKFQFIYLNDWIINHKNQSFMPWTFQYKTMEEWQELVESCGFTTIENNFLGVVRKGREKQGTTVFMVFEK